MSEFGGCFDKCLVLEFPKESYIGMDGHAGLAFLSNGSIKTSHKLY